MDRVIKITLPNLKLIQRRIKMISRKTMLNIAVSTTLAGGMMTYANIATAADILEEAATTLGVTADSAKEGKCGEGKCGGDKAGKAKEGKCGEGKCGGDKAKKEGKCGEGKCGGAKTKKEGKCGEGKCGGAK